MAERPRVVVTGIGVVSPLGPQPSFWDRLQRGVTGIAPTELLATGPHPPRLAAEVREWSPRDHIAPAALRRMDRLSRMVVTACKYALDDGKVVLTPEAAEETAVVIGSAIGDISETETFMRGLLTKGPGLVNPMTFPNLVLNSMTGYVAINFGLRGPNHAVCRGDASGEAALALAYDLIATEQADLVLAGGADELAQVLFEIQKDQRLLSPLAARTGGGAPTRGEWSSPFDRRRNGFVMGEGAAVVLLERAEHARARQVRVYAEFTGYCSYPVRSTPHAWPPLAAVRTGTARRRDGEDVDVFARDPSAPGIDLVVCSANSSPQRDAFEAAQLAALLAGAPDAVVTSVKGSIGEFGAAGAFSVVAAVLGLHSGGVPRMGTLEEPDPAVTLRLATAATPDPPDGFRRGLVTVAPRGGGYLALEFRRFSPTP